MQKGMYLAELRLDHRLFERQHLSCWRDSCQSRGLPTSKMGTRSGLLVVCTFQAQGTETPAETTKGVCCSCDQNWLFLPCFLALRLGPFSAGFPGSPDGCRQLPGIHTFHGGKESLCPAGPSQNPKVRSHGAGLGPLFTFRAQEWRVVGSGSLG